MKRQEISEEFKWDLSKIIKDDEDFKTRVDKVKELSQEILNLKGTILSNGENLKKYLTLSNEMNLNIEKLYLYSHLLYYSDTTNNLYKEKSLLIEKLNEDTSTKLSFVDTELLSKDYDYVMSLLSEEDKKEYKFYFEKMFRYQSMILSEAEEKIISEALSTFGTGEDTFSEIDDTDIYLGNIIVNGEEVELTHSNYSRFIQHKDRNVRISAFKTLAKYYMDRKNTISSCYKGKIKENFFLSKLRKFDSPLEYSLYHDNIDKKLYTNLISACHDKNYLMYDYMNLRKKYLNLDEIHMYDIHVDLIDEEEKNISLEECKRILLEALKPLGKTYINDLKKMFSNGSIDYLPNDGKRSGAYEWSTYNVDPYVSLNYENNFDGVSTLAHELGHAMHSYYSDKNNSYLYNAYPIFLAEIASTVNEVLLDEYMLKNAVTDEERILYISKFLDKVRATIFRQTMLAEFEMIMHDKYQNNIPLTESEFSKTYYELNKLYYGDAMVSDPEIAYEWSRVPHFYTSFYVYKYATGLSAALIIANDILNKKPGALENYMKFLSSGGSDYPLEILKKCGVDMTDKSVLESAFTLFEERLNELKELTEVKKKCLKITTKH